MWPTADLRQDHEALRAQLALLERLALQGEDARPTLRVLFSAFQRHWHCHVEREALIAGRLPSSTNRLPSRSIDALLDQIEAGLAGPLPLAAATIARLATSVRERCAQEEQRLFPAIDRAIGLARDDTLRQGMRDIVARHFHDGPPRPSEPWAAMTARMPIQEIVRLHPRMGSILRAFQVDPETEALASLEALRGRPGLDVDALWLAVHAALRESQMLGALVPDIVWQSAVGIMAIDAQRRILAMNPALERLTGRRNQDVVGRQECGALFACRDLHRCTLADHPEQCPGLRAMAQFEPVANAEYIIKTAAGRRVVIGATYTPVQVRPGGPIWSLALMRDITGQKRREYRLLRRAMTDPLTGVANRTGLQDACRRELLEAIRHHRPLAVVMADLDGLKAHNDAYGHPAGDTVLKTVAGLLQTGHRQTELVARYGGDEFVLLLPDTDVRGALRVVTRLQRVVADFPFRAAPLWLGEPSADSALPVPAPVTMSAGIAVFPEDGTTTEALIQQADRRLYEAKQRGRGQVTAPAWSGERRRHRRLNIEAPVEFRSGQEPESAAWEAVSKNLSRDGVFCLVPSWTTIARGARLRVGVLIPEALQAKAGFTGVAGPGRVVRIEDAIDGDGPAPHTRGVAIEFLG
jgi:diguanylate cyclase (GGDEF)-like protein/PAS domain S-box-containing protein